MAKPRKNYSKGKKPRWQWIVFYLVIGGIIYALLYYSGLVGFGNKNTSAPDYSTSDYEYVE